MNIYRYLFLYFVLMLTGSLSAQTKVEGEAAIKAGIGHTTPYGANLDLKISTPRLTIKPFIGINGSTPYSTSQTESTIYQYSASGFLYNSNFNTKAKGYDLIYGTELKYDINPHNTLSAYIRGNHKDMSVEGTRTEYLGMDDDSNLSLISSYHNPLRNADNLDVEAAYVHRTDRVGENMTVKYSYSLASLDEETHQKREAGDYILFERENDIFQKAKTQMHSILFDWRRPIAKGHVLDLGVRYDDKTITSSDRQLIDQWEGLNEDFEHHTRTAAAFAAYNLNVGAVTATARVEYDYTRMQERNLNDIIPMARIQWQMNPRNSLSASYGMRLIRPGINVLNPARITGSFTLDYGNAELTGTHANNVSLAYNLTGKKAKFTTTLSHIFADDGFCAIWMVKDGVRVSTWGNAGVRRAWSLTPEVRWNASPKTLVTAKATVMWDKRIAYAINMAKEHWGIDTKVAVQQVLPCDIKLGVHADYSEGNTVDLYSHYGRLFLYGLDLEHSFLQGKNLTARLSLDRKDAPKVILTQGAYTGSYRLYPESGYAIGMNLSYKF